MGEMKSMLTITITSCWTARALFTVAVASPARLATVPTATTIASMMIFVYGCAVV